LRSFPEPGLSFCVHPIETRLPGKSGKKTVKPSKVLSNRKALVGSQVWRSGLAVRFDNSLPPEPLGLVHNEGDKDGTNSGH
jgi:hypothetical protein